MESTDARNEKFKSVKNDDRRTYAGMMSAMDDAVGAVIAKLRDAGLEDDTLVVFFSDNGGPTMQGTTQNASDNSPLRGSKRTTLEGGVRVPFFVKWPAKIKPGAKYEEPVIQLDVTRTALAIAGAEVGPADDLDGVDLMPFLAGGEGRPHDALFWRFGQQMAIRKGDWKLVRYDPRVDGESGRATPVKLYNLADDIGESHDLSAAHPEKVAELQSDWKEWDRDNVPPSWGAQHLKKKKRGEAKVRG